MVKASETFLHEYALHAQSLFEVQRSSMEHVLGLLSPSMPHADPTRPNTTEKPGSASSVASLPQNDSRNRRRKGQKEQGSNPGESHTHTHTHTHTHGIMAMKKIDIGSFLDCHHVIVK